MPAERKAAGNDRDGLSKQNWTIRRLMTMAELRGAPYPSTDALKAFASALSGFTDAVIDAGCQKLERATVGDYESRMPTLAILVESCRVQVRAKSSTLFNHNAYMRDVRANRDNYVSLADIVRELNDKRRAEGKSLCIRIDPKVGDAA